MLGNLIAAAIIIMIGFTLMPVIAEQVESSVEASNATSSAAETLAKITPVFFTLAIVAAVIGILFNGLRSGGLIGNDDYEEIDEIPEPVKEKPKKQTYLDYVRERLTAEKMFRWRI